MGSTATKDSAKPWISNYPPLEAWLRKIDAHCQDQIPVGNARKPVAYLEKWITTTGRSFIVEVRANQMGWNIFTEGNYPDVASTLTDAGKRLGLV